MSDGDEAGPLPQPNTPRNSLGQLSGSSSVSSSSSSNTSQSKTAVNECLAAWGNYLQILNNLCSSGYRLAQSLAALEQWGHHSDSPAQSHSQTSSTSSSTPLQTQCTVPWDDLARATAVATQTVKSHVVSVLNDFMTSSMAEQQSENDPHRIRDHNQQIILEVTQTMINIQHQFCAASYEAFSTLMCCFVCQAPVGFSHDPECAMIQHKPSIMAYLRSHTPSPNQRTDANRGPPAPMYGSGSTQASSEHCFVGLEQTRGPSPHQEIRGPSPIQGFLDNIRGPLPNPGQLLAMKAPFYRGSRSPLNFPLFPLNGQRRWSEAAAGEVRVGESSVDVESQMRRWSMPWEASKTDKNTVTWHQTRIMPVSKLAVPNSRANSERSHSPTPDALWQASTSNTSHDGLAEAIQLLSCRPVFKPQPQPIGPPFIEEPAPYEMWPTSSNQDRLPSIKFPSREQERDEPQQ